ncbi:MAG TPA: hypothetical protein VGK24_02345 [Candidatus Angelobacter sp.]|jgi:hypothetical protein
MRSLIKFLVGVTFSVLVTSAAGQVQCGRVDWINTAYDYYPGHQLDNSKAAAVVQVSENVGHISIVIYKPAQKRAFYYSPEYFETQNNGRSWQVLTRDQPQHLPILPYTYFQSPSESRILYKLLPDIGLYLRSEDTGRTWILPQYEIDGKPASKFAEQISGSHGFHLEIRIVAVHPHEPKTLYAAAWVRPWPNSDEELKDHKLVGVYRSLDSGDHWNSFSEEVLAFGLNWTESLPLGINPSNPNFFLAVGRHGIEKSEDGGKSWEPVGQADLFNTRPIYRAENRTNRKMLGAPVATEVYEFLFDPHAEQIIYMLTNKGLFKTTDRGKSWRLLELGFDEIDAITSVGLNPIHSNQIVVGSRHGLYLSNDGGCHFQAVRSPGEQATTSVQHERPN